MQFHFSFRHMETSEALQTYAEEKLTEKILKYVTKPIEAHVSFSVVRHEHVAHCSLRAGDGFSIDVEHSCGDMYGSIDHMVDKLAAQLKKHKEKLKDHKHEKSLRQLALGEEAGEGLGHERAAVEVVDAGDIVKYEERRRRAGSH
jgi:putative sigma-54 modulation protein